MAQPHSSNPIPVGIAEYLAAEQRGTVRHEYRNGTVVAMPGASRNHVLITPRLSQLIQGGLGDSTCMYLDQDVQVLIPEIRTYTYPDGAVACPPIFDEGPTAALLNPKVIFEVLSPSTEGYDRGTKFRNYRRIATFEEYVLIDSDEFVVEVLRAPEWGVKTYEGLDAVARVESLGIELSLRELYLRLLPSS